jgi:hypothetical protein
MSGIHIKRSQVRTPAQKIKMCFKTCPKTKIQVEIWQNFPENREDVTNFMLLLTFMQNLTQEEKEGCHYSLLSFLCVL